MIRRPTPRPVLYAWHSAAIEAARHPMTILPECGWFVIRLEDKAPFLPASIYMEQPVDELGDLTGPEIMRCEIGGQAVELSEDMWLMLATRPISQNEYNTLMAQLMSGNYSGPKRPRCRWNDSTEVNADLAKYEAAP